MRNLNFKRDFTKFLESKFLLDDKLDGLRETFGCDPESPFVRAMFHIEESYLECLENVYDESALEGDSWLSWYVYENDCGRSGMEAIIDGVEKAIITVEDLMWAMGVEDD